MTLSLDEAMAGLLGVGTADFDAHAFAVHRYSNGCTPLFWVSSLCPKSPIELARLLIEAGADINARSSAGATSLHYAVVAGNPALCSFLVESCADAQAIDAQGRRPVSLIQLSRALDVGVGVASRKKVRKSKDHLKAEADRQLIRKTLSRGCQAVLGA